MNPAVHIVLGSGLGEMERVVSNPTRVPFGRLPGFVRTSVQGHDGCFVLGRVGGVEVLVQSGRLHLYEGAEPDAVAAPVRVGRRLGAEMLILTNAVGGIRSDLHLGGIVLVEDHLNLMFRPVLTVPPLEGEAPFPDMSRPYDPGLMALAKSIAREMDVELPLGVYGAVAGPSFETPAEVRALAAAGADVVGMSTVPEVTVARAGGQRVLALSVVTNWAAGLAAGPISHADTLHRAEEGGRVLATLLTRLVGALPAGPPATGAERSG